MKKQKLIFKINRNNTAKIYVGGKLQKYVSAVEIDAKPFCHDIKIEQIKHGSNGQLIIENNDVIRTEKHFHFGTVEYGRI